ncbi:MAG: hypothetical protein ACK40Q_08820, partial [Pseudothermotoga sp.]
MKRVDTIKKKIEQIEDLLAEIKGELEALSEKGEAKPKKQRQAEEVIPSYDELRLEYDRLYQDFIASNSRAVEEFIKGKSKTYLKAFCRANNLDVDTTKVSKSRIVDIV